MKKTRPKKSDELRPEFIRNRQLRDITVHAVVVVQPRDLREVRSRAGVPREVNRPLRAADDEAEPERFIRVQEAAP